MGMCMIAHDQEDCVLSIHDERLGVRMLNEPKLGTATVVGRKLRS